MSATPDADEDDLGTEGHGGFVVSLPLPEGHWVHEPTGDFQRRSASLSALIG